MNSLIFVYCDKIIMKDIWTFFAFPLNLILASLWSAILLWLRKSFSQSAVVRFLHSPAATISSIVLLITACLWIGFSGDRTFPQTLIFVLVLLYIQSVLFLITIRGLRKVDGKLRWRFIFLHVGLLLAIGSGFWGSPDSTESRMRLMPEMPSREAVTVDGMKSVLPYELSLTDLRIEYSDEGQMIDYEVFVSVDGEDPVSISVNHPYGIRFGEDIYLVGVSEESCVLQIVREPWRYFALAGVIMMLAGAFLLFVNGPNKR